MAEWIVIAWLAAPVVIAIVTVVYYLVDERVSSPRYRRAKRHASLRRR